MSQSSSADSLKCEGLRSGEWLSTWRKGAPHSLHNLRRAANILIVDDNRAEARLIVEALKETPMLYRAQVVYNGEAAVAYLRHSSRELSSRGQSSRELSSREHPRPDIVLLDLYLPIPTLGGQEVLRLIKTDPDLRAIPVVMLAGSNRPEDIEASYAAQANCYVQKPVDLDDLVSLLCKISEFWLGFALPIALL